MIGAETAARVGIRVSRVADEQFVYERCAGSPVAEHEDRVFRDLRSGDSAAVDQLLQQAERRVAQAQAAENCRHWHARGGDGEVVACQRVNHPEEFMPDQARKCQGRYMWSVAAGF